MPSVRLPGTDGYARRIAAAPTNYGTIVMLCRNPTGADISGPFYLDAPATSKYAIGVFGWSGGFTTERDGGAGYASADIWKDPFADWFWFGMVLDAGGQSTIFWKRLAGQLQTGPSIGTGDAGTQLTLGTSQPFAVSYTQPTDVASVKCWRIPLDPVRLGREFMQRRPVTTENLVFANACQSTGSFTNDESGSGLGGLTVVGALQDLADEPPGIPLVAGRGGMLGANS